MIFEYGELETAYLKKKDKRMSALIERLGHIEREVTPDPFAMLINSIVSQQISGKAAETVYARLRKMAGGEMKPGKLISLTQEEIQSCGMSMRKAGYIRGIVQAADEKVDFSKLPLLDDEEIIRQLTALPGVGLWTVEMLLLFSLGRPDVLSYGDFAIRKGMMRLYGYKEFSRERFERLRKRYSPHGSVASLYLWQLAGEPG